MQRMRGETALVTGATGFIGGNLAAGLLREGAHVITIERDRKANNTLKALGIADQVTIVSGCISDAALMERVFNEHEVEWCFHLAAQAIVPTANFSPLSTFESNIGGTWAVLEGARRGGWVKGVVVASSDKAYGVHETMPYTEDMRLLGRYPYDASKVCTDVLAQCYHHTWDMPVAITRNANTYGPGDLNMTRLIPDCIRATLQGDLFEIRSDGEMRRDFMFIGDAVEAYVQLAQALGRGELYGEAFNFGSGQVHAVKDVCQKIFDCVGGPHPEPKILNQALYEIPVQYTDITKCQDRFDWAPETSLEEGIAQTVAWYRDYLGC